jgi:subtilisin family serine protease
MDIANLSLGAKGQSEALHTAVANATVAGVTLVVAAGNESDDAEDYIPATYDEVITVSAIADFDGQPGGLASPEYYGRGRFKIEQQDDAFAYFSNYGQDIDLAAPGVEIYSTYTNGKYETLSGTSMAAPHVAGAAALYIFTNAPMPDDVNGDGTATVTEVVCLALQNAGWVSGDYKYFSGDPDIYPEPLLKADAL